jgi:hypothetical protein
MNCAERNISQIHRRDKNEYAQKEYKITGMRGDEDIL